MRTVVTNCHLIDGVSDDAKPDASIAIDGGRIVEVATNGAEVDTESSMLWAAGCYPGCGTSTSI